MRKELKVFNIIWLGQSLSLLGSKMSLFALGIWIWQLTGNATDLAYLAAFYIWLQGNATLNPDILTNGVCNPDSLIQAHGIWHLLTAVSTIFFFYHYRSEKSL